ncbi:hypothetical protein F2Q68_00012087 [Brassica cretica]|uniref:Uncharacterized protein n=1 Tax=Brassica cretica TaxID=69181 RepID=A0A8S9KYM8_BRACR|nr:hypothetical protein F2Q68_00012087 [Brassica cretica]
MARGVGQHVADRAMVGHVLIFERYWYILPRGEIHKGVCYEGFQSIESDTDTRRAAAEPFLSSSGRGDLDGGERRRWSKQSTPESSLLKFLYWDI